MKAYQLIKSFSSRRDGLLTIKEVALLLSKLDRAKVTQAAVKALVKTGRLRPTDILNSTYVAPLDIAEYLRTR